MSILRLIRSGQFTAGGIRSQQCDRHAEPLRRFLSILKMRTLMDEP